MLLYRIFLFCYRQAARIAALFNEKAAKWVKAQRTALSDIQNWQPQQPVIWMHCASLGEFEQGLPVLEAIRSQFPNYTLLLSFFSPSGYEPCREHPAADKVVYLPIDGKQTAADWVEKIQPSLVIFIKYEFWYYYLEALHNKKIPVLLVSAVFRPSQPFFHWYGGFYRKMLQFYAQILVQNESSARLLQTLSVPVPVMVAGDSRFDRVIQVAATPTSFPVIEEFIKGMPVFIAGSTWPEDDKALQHFVHNNPSVRHIIVPHLTDAASIDRCLQTYPHSVTYSNLMQQWEKGQSIPDNYSTLIIDTIGLLRSIYRYATLAYVGGGFGGEGIHNVLEATVYGKPVVIGPVYDKFIEATELVERKGILVVNNAIELETQLSELLKDASLRESIEHIAKQFTHDRGGAAQRVIQLIQEKRLLTK